MTRPLEREQFTEIITERLTSERRLEVIQDVQALEERLEKRLEDEKARKKKWKTRTEKMQKRQRRLLKVASTGEQKRGVLCRHEAHLDENELVTINTETGNIIESLTRPLNAEESAQVRQMGLAFTKPDKVDEQLKDKTTEPEKPPAPKTEKPRTLFALPDRTPDKPRTEEEAKADAEAVKKANEAPAERKRKARSPRE